MSSISYDPDRVPDIDNRLFDKAKAYGMQIVHIIRDERGAKVGEPTGVSFFAIVPTVPRIGERLHLHDKSVCTVRQIHWSLVTDPDGLMRLVPNLYAERIRPADEKE
jgi:hypothetical protein